MHATIYVHYDGELEGVGQFLHKFLDGLVVVNGIGRDMPERYANGADRLASQLVAAMEQEDLRPGLIEHGSEADQEYHYQIDVLYGTGGGTVTLTVFDDNNGDDCTNQIFHGSVEAFGRFLDEYDEYAEDEA